MNVEQAIALAGSTLGPTTDLSATMQRVYFDFPALSALPDTEILGTNFTFLTDFRGDWKSDSIVLFSTSAAPEDAVLTYQNEFTALFPEDDVQTSVQQNGDVVLHVASIGGTTIVARDVEGVTLVEIDATQMDTSAAQIEAIAGITPFAFRSEQGVLASVSLDHQFRTPQATIIVTEPVDEDTFLANEAATAAELGWALIESDESSSSYSVDGVSADALVLVDSRTDTDGNPVARVQTQFFFG